MRKGLIIIAGLLSASAILAAEKEKKDFNVLFNNSR